MSIQRQRRGRPKLKLNKIDLGSIKRKSAPVWRSKHSICTSTQVEGSHATYYSQFDAAVNSYFIAGV
jgi:hypothetical protein